MHELSIAQNILEIVHQHVTREQESGIRKIKLRIGEQSGVVPDSLEFCFSAMISGTALEHAALAIERIPLTMRCGNCGRESRVDFGAVTCPGCGSGTLTMISGTELEIVEIELEDGDDGTG